MRKKLKTLIKNNYFLLNTYEYFFQKPITNYYNRNHGKKVLFSYSTYHFNKKNYTAHSNYQESLLIAEIFDRLGFAVDIVNNNRTYKIDYNQYDVIFGEGLPIYEAIRSNTSALTIYYATGSHPWQCSNASLARVIDYYKKRKYTAIQSTRLMDYRWGLAASLSDAVICIGNHQTEKTFKDNGVEYIYLIHPTFHAKTKMETILKSDNANKTLLYFASYGLLHKGLDLVIDAIRELPDFTLHVCGYTEKEKDFIQTLEIPDNVVIHGFIDIDADIFRRLSAECGYVVLPSSSEGIATAVITAMGRGAMIPIVTKECGVDIKDFGIEIKELKAEAVKESIQHSQTFSQEEFLAACTKAQIEAYNEYTIDQFKNKMEQYLEKLIFENFKHA